MATSTKRNSSRHIYRLTNAEKQESRGTTKEVSAQERGSVFTVKAVKVTSLNHVRAACKVLLVNMQATHNAADYVLHNAPTSKTPAAFCDYGEFGMGRVMRYEIHKCKATDVAVFMTLAGNA